MGATEGHAEPPENFNLHRDNSEFSQCDVALVIGANDVTNPAARHDKSSPMYGIPILDVDKARTVMVIKRSCSATPECLCRRF